MCRCAICLPMYCFLHVFFFRQNHIQSFIDSSPAIHSETGLHGNINGLEVPGRSYNWADKPMSQLWLFVMVKYSQMKSEISHSNLNIVSNIVKWSDIVKYSQSCHIHSYPHFQRLPTPFVTTFVEDDSENQQMNL